MRRFLLGFCLLCCLCISPLQATTYQLLLDTISTKAWQTQGLSMELQWRSNQPWLFLKAKSLTFANNILLNDIELECALSQSITVILCQQGKLKANHPQYHQITTTFQIEHYQAEIRTSIRMDSLQTHFGKFQLKASLEGQSWTVDLKGNNQPLPALITLAEKFLLSFQAPDDLSGNATFSAQLAGNKNGLRKLSSSIKINELNFNLINAAAQDLQARLQLQIEASKSGWNVNSEMSLHQGGLYIEPGFKLDELTPGFTLEINDKPTVTRLQGTWNNNSQTLSISELTHHHPDTGDFRASLILAPTSATPIQPLAITVDSDTLQSFYDVYLQPILLQSSLNDLEASGAIHLDLQFADNDLSQLQIQTRDVYLYDNANRFHLDQLNIGVVLGHQINQQAAEIRWSGAGIYRLDLGASHFAMLTNGFDLALIDSTEIPLLDGQLKIDRLVINAIGHKDMLFEADTILTPIDLQALCLALEWPIMNGRFSGVIPGLRYQHHTLSINGTLLARAFGGNIVVRNLLIEDLFDPVPILSTDISLNRLDMEALTQTFSFGHISGLLQGHINNLQLQAWQPVQFNAWFGNPEDDDSRHRISQKAVNNLTKIGGGEAAADLSSGFMKFFKEFSYDQLALGCRLQDNVCFMHGLDDADTGYAIVKRGLLPPWVDIIGHNRQVDWPILVNRLKSIAAGNAPVIK